MHTTHFSGKNAHLSNLTTQCDFDDQTQTNQNTTRTSPLLMGHAHHTFQRHNCSFVNSMQFMTTNENKPKHHPNVSTINEPCTLHISVVKITHLSTLTTQCDFDDKTKTSTNTTKTSQQSMNQAYVNSK